MNQSLLVSTMNSRRAFRVFGSLHPMLSVWNGPGGRSDDINKLIYRLSMMCVCLWHWLDHIRYLSVLRWIDSAKEGPLRKLSFSLHTFGRFLLFIYHYRLLRSARTETDRRQSRIQVAKACMDVVTFAHVSELYPTSDLVCGTLGATSSAIDLALMW